MKINKGVYVISLFFGFFINLIVFCFAKDFPDTLINLLPTQINAFIAEAPYTYPQKELGTSIAYNAVGRGTITVYLYDLGTQSIEDGIKSDSVLRSKEMAMRDIKLLETRGMYRNVTIKANAPVILSLEDTRTLEALCVSYSYDAIDEDKKSVDPVISELYIVGLRGYICKIRATRRMHVSELEVRQVIETIVSSLIKADERM